MSRLTQDANYYYYSYQYRDFTFCVLPFQVIPVQIIIIYVGPTTPTLPEQHRFGLFPFRSPLLGESNALSLPQGTKMFQFPRYCLCNLCIQLQILWVYHSRFSDSVIPGSKDACSSPGLIAACHDLTLQQSLLPNKLLDFHV